MRLVSIHPDVGIQDVYNETGFELPDTEVAVTRKPSDHELDLIRTVLDPDSRRDREVKP
jgi:hypothetical protein